MGDAPIDTNASRGQPANAPTLQLFGIQPFNPAEISTRGNQIKQSKMWGFTPQTLFFNADTGKALTTVLAGLAFTITSLPNTSLFPAFVAGFNRVLIMHRPGNVNLPTLFTCFVPTSAKASMIFEQSFGLISVLPDNSWQRADLLMALAPVFMAFITIVDKTKSSSTPVQVL